MFEMVSAVVYACLPRLYISHYNNIIINETMTYVKMACGKSYVLTASILYITCIYKLYYLPNILLAETGSYWEVR